MYSKNWAFGIPGCSAVTCSARGIICWLGEKASVRDTRLCGAVSGAAPRQLRGEGVILLRSPALGRLRPECWVRSWAPQYARDTDALE